MLQVVIKRKVSADSESFWQSFAYELTETKETVSTILTRLNERQPLLDTQGQEAGPILWERSCLQGKCGACAMVINGVPDLACRREVSQKDRTLRLEPLRKFPALADLVVDRQSMFENLKTLGVWLSEDPVLSEKTSSFGLDASRCMQCGCCLEICPNFAAEGRFAGVAAAVPAARILAEQSSASGNAGEAEALRRRYRRMIFEGCGKSLACRSVCPAGLELDAILARSNAAAVWRRRSVFGV